ncbi:putative DNA binding domain-containing protein [Dellaglioa algida]|uniref:RNA-binding domain-containing protein n=1 Tax=Dellaglioa algida TaxID=105612 RepID=UPI0024C4D7AC|nr:RNA-binding domain-containing protein [Dellaglioa algida]MDK1724786.1 putative DNA binding domain-containing protein [Dellaglioa algida]MDK1738674.1 putative DNA binding domain-containing protein [Dellaglioa algida]
MLETENIQLEYKTSSDKLPKSFWETYSAFANTKGGFIVLGVSENPKGNFKIVGVENQEKIRTDLLNLVCDKTKVSTNLIDETNITILQFEGKTTINIEIPEASFMQKPVYLNNSKENCYIRLGDGDHKATPAQFKYMIANSSDEMDSELLDNYTVDDLNVVDVETYRSIIIKNTGDQSLQNLTYSEFLFSIGATKIDYSNADRKQKLTIAGLLFFGNYNAITSRYPNFQLDYFKKYSSLDSKWENRVSTGDMNFPNLNIFSFYNKVSEILYNNIPDKFTQDADMTRGSYYADMKNAIKEALVNTIMHAYYGSDTPIRIDEYNDYLEFYNPGNMRVSKQEFIHGNTSKCRNGILSLLFRKVGIAEKAGSGGPTIFGSAQKNSLRTPDIKNQSDSTSIRIWKTDLASSLKDLDENQTKIVLFAVDVPTFKIKDAVNQLKLSDYTVRNTVDELIENKILIKIGNGRSTAYSTNRNEESGMLGMKLLLKRVEDDFNSPN